ncbi:MAG: universal stress protein [Actinomycetota bacterium]
MDAIVVPIGDPSDARLTIRCAFAVAQRMQCRVVLTSVCSSAEVDPRDRALRAAAVPFGDVAPWTVTVVDASSDIVSGTLSVSEAHNAMVCLRVSDRGAVSRWLSGSVAEDVMRTSQRPTLCVGPAVTHVPLLGEEVDVVVSTDDSRTSEVVFDAASAFAAGVGAASCEVVQAVGPDEDVAPSGGSPPTPLRDRARKHLAEGVARIARRGVRATAQVLPGHPERALVAETVRQEAGFIVVGTTGRTGIGRVTVGSVAAEVVRRSPCPVLVVPTSR